MRMSEISMQQLKEQRMSPAEKFVLDTIKGVKPSEPIVNGDVRWVNKDGRFLLKQSFNYGILWIGYEHIRYVLAKEYNLNNNEIIQLLTKLLYKYTNNGQLKISF